MRGPQLLLTSALMVASLVAWIVLTSDAGLVPTAASVVRWTARSSLLLFAMAYVARPAQQLWRNAFTRHLLRERKWIGLGFAVSHLAHLGGIIALASPDFGAFVRAQAPTTAFAAVTFVLIFAMAITSIEAVKRAMSARAWKLLHRTGMHFAWIAFTATYVPAIAADARYAIPAAVLLGLGAIRLTAWLRTSRSRARLA